MLRLILAISFLLSACEKDETVSGFVDPEMTYHLVEINGAKFAPKASIQFPETGAITGKSPCNSFGGKQSAPYPWLEFGPFRATRRACGKGSGEREFFAALGSMTEVEAFDDTLILRNEDGGEMVFTTVQP